MIIAKVYRKGTCRETKGEKEKKNKRSEKTERGVEGLRAARHSDATPRLIVSENVTVTGTVSFRWKLARLCGYPRFHRAEAKHLFIVG